MKIVLNTHSDEAAGRVCIYELGRRLREGGVDATVNDWSGYEGYDVAVFMGYDHELDRARAENPRIRIALADPKQSRPEWIDAARRADFLLVSSVEQRETFYRLNRNVLVYYMFPDVPVRPKEHWAKEPVVIGYHGNRVHLESMLGALRPALEELARRRRIEFWAIYNLRQLGRARIGMPDPEVVPTRHVQWEPDYAPLADVDVGVAPTELPIRNRSWVLEEAAYPEPELVYEPFDHLVRFKASANPGRLYPFAQFGVPVVADWTPSASQLVLDGDSGFLASSPYGWLEALEALVDSPQLRARMAEALRRRLQVAFEAQVGFFLDYCTNPLKGAPTPFPELTTAEEDLARLDRFARPTPPNVWRRALGRVRRGVPL